MQAGSPHDQSLFGEANLPAVAEYGAGRQVNFSNCGQIAVGPVEAARATSKVYRIGNDGERSLRQRQRGGGCRVEGERVA